MNEFPQNIKFKYPWRKYQQRVLDELQEHLTDNHLHVVAPPGSGKTILGLEVAIRLNKPTLILAPSLAIRNQWINRFCDCFLQVEKIPEWISTDIRKPGFLTVVTYQGLHAACNGNEASEIEPDEESDEAEEVENALSDLTEIVKNLRKSKIGTIVVDEAHHLKNEWWHTLTKVKDQLAPTLIGLTATPPYDVTVNEWRRYTEMNGPVDAEISVPELVKENDLCPHQDYVYLTLPSVTETNEIIDFRKNLNKLTEDIKADHEFISFIERSQIWVNPSSNYEFLYENLAFYSSCLIFLNALNRPVSQYNLEIIGEPGEKIPVLTNTWLQTLLDFYIHFPEHFPADSQDHRAGLENRLRNGGAMQNKKVNLVRSKKVSNSLTQSSAKLDAVVEIVQFEYEQLRDHLRCVVLSDYIKKEYLADNRSPEVMGVVPLFEKLRRNNPENFRIGVLTGSIVIIPVTALSFFEARLGKANFIATPLDYDSGYLQLQISDGRKSQIVHHITEIFQQGHIQVLVGTKSLLGEGWDAPAINSLILASFVGSFVLSNQMRGRAIRKQQGNNEKTGNVWHIVCVDPTEHDGGDDLMLLKRRFESFVGVSLQGPALIENGYKRLELPLDTQGKPDIISSNVRMFLCAKDRIGLKKRWDDALINGRELVKEIKLPFIEEQEYEKSKTLYLNKTIAYLLATLFSGLGAFGLGALAGFGKSMKHVRSVESVYFYLGIAAVLAVIFFGGLTLRVFRLYFKYRDISKDIKKIGEVLLDSLKDAGLIKPNPKLNVTCFLDDDGAVFCHLDGGSTFEKSVFIDSLEELIGPVNNPKYVILRKSKILALVRQTDYHSVPEEIARKKAIVESFAKKWRMNVGDCDLIYTRSIEGRRLILKARQRSLAVQFDDENRHVNKWR